MPARSADDVRIETYGGPRDDLRALFELAEDSAAELDSYIDAGRVLVAVSDGEIIGHLQLTGTDDPRQVEIKNMAVRETRQGQGIGRRLIHAAVDLAAAEAVTTILVATAAADIGNLRFYQRQAGVTVGPGELRFHQAVVCLRALVEVASWVHAGTVDAHAGHPWLINGPVFARRVARLTGAPVRAR